MGQLAAAIGSFTFLDTMIHSTSHVIRAKRTSRVLRWEAGTGRYLCGASNQGKVCSDCYHFATAIQLGLGIDKVPSRIQIHRIHPSLRAFGLNVTIISENFALTSSNDTDLKRFDTIIKITIMKIDRLIKIQHKPTLSISDSVISEVRSRRQTRN